jgi:hypothetical protein
MLTNAAICVKISLIAFEQEPVTKHTDNRELSVGARQLFGLGEFILQAADLKLSLFGSE